MTELEQAIIDCARLHLAQLKGALALPNGPERSDSFTSAGGSSPAWPSLPSSTAGLASPPAISCALSTARPPRP
jgi:hypothetical protein